MDANKVVYSFILFVFQSSQVSTNKKVQITFTFVLIDNVRSVLIIIETQISSSYTDS